MMGAFGLSVLLGLVVATIGAWKDTQWESFSFKTYIRSPLISGFWSIPLSLLFKESPILLISLSAISMERFTVEFWKALLRKMPSKFKNEEKDTRWLRKKVRAYS